MSNLFGFSNPNPYVGVIQTNRSVSLHCARMKIFTCFLVLLTAADHPCFAKSRYNSTANLSTTWINNDDTLAFWDRSAIVKVILLGGAPSFESPKYACGFFCNGSCIKYIFAIFIIASDGEFIQSASPPVVWSANRDYPVSFHSTLQLTSDGDLVLKDVDGATAWSTNTSGKSVVGMNMTETGNLVLYNSQNEAVWQSFDHPTDALVNGQRLFEGQSLTSSTSATNWARGIFSLSVSRDELFALIQGDPPQVYYRYQSDLYFKKNETKDRKSFIELTNGSLSLHFHYKEPNGLYIPSSSSIQYIKLDSDGHLKVYEWVKLKDIIREWDTIEWRIVSDLLTGGECKYPLICGEHGLCSTGKCSCLVTANNRTSDSKPITVNRSPPGCGVRYPFNCDDSLYPEFQEFTDITYISSEPDIIDTDEETCKEACLRKCSCKAATFRYMSYSARGNCYLPSEIRSLMINDNKLTYYNSTAFVKVQGSPLINIATPERNRKRTTVIIGASITAFFVLFLLAGFIFLVKRRKMKEDIDEEEYLDQVPGMPTRFSYEELKIATEDFIEKLGEGGFGSVFKGKLNNGTQIAVKLLDGVGHVRKAFLAEVETIGSLHHINLVTLIGFCAEKYHRGLVYEYMPNGSLEKWIFKPKTGNILDWKQRRKIISDIAKGLSYLHEDCRQKIVHLDIKPQNILLDEKFNAKVSDFGLSKLIDKDKSNVMTIMRGTPGYLAPEWLNSVITEKVDVYSFGIVVLEILCGRKNLDSSQAYEEMHLLSLFKSRGEENSLFDLVDKCSQDMQLHGEEVIEMMKVAAWCLQRDFTKRPSMSVVVKVLEGVMDIDKSVKFTSVTDMECFKPKMRHDDTKRICGTSTSIRPFVLSGPR